MIVIKLKLNLLKRKFNLIYFNYKEILKIIEEIMLNYMKY